MGARLSDRLAAIVDALPLEPGLRVLEVGGAPGAAAVEVARRVGETGHVLVIDRSVAGAAQTRRRASELIDAGVLSVRCVAIEDFVLGPDEEPYDLAFAVRVGCLDGRHPRLRQAAHRRILDALRPGGRLFIDGGDPLQEIAV